MKKIILTILFIPNILLAIPLTLNEYTSKNPLWSSSDRSSLSYITLRCGVLFKQISNNHNQAGVTKDIYKLTTMNAEKFIRYSSDIYKTSCINYECIKVEKKASQEKQKQWTLIYKNALVSNINNFGEMIYGDVKSDFSTCKTKVTPILE